MSSKFARGSTWNSIMPYGPKTNGKIYCWSSNYRRPADRTAYRDIHSEIAKRKLNDVMVSCREKLSELTRCLDMIDEHIQWNPSREFAIQADTPGNQLVSTRKSDTNKKLSANLQESHAHLQELADLSQRNADGILLEELHLELTALMARSDAFLTSILLSNPLDSNGAYIDIKAGSGGTEACDWTSMLSRMYINWARIRDCTVEIVDESPAEVAGIKSATLLVRGRQAFGYSQFESGIHRLVRTSPFDRGGNRHTSFASVQVSPQIEEAQPGTVELNPSELQITTMRSQGAGGQHVNKTESAVRIVHVPTKVTVTCQKERSQHRNKTLAMSLLKAKLYDLERKKQALGKSQSHMSLPENSWGSQIRSYVLNPYQLVKDSRTGHEERDTRRILDGEVHG